MAAPRFEPSRWLPGAHAHTIYASLFAAAPPVEYRRERWDTPDGDFADVDFIDGPVDAPSVHLFHGLEGSSRSHYARVLMHAVRARGWRGSVLNFRGCSGEANRLPRAYHSGDSGEVDWVMRRMKERLGAAPLYAAGVSLGGNALLKWLGEAGDEAKHFVNAASAISAPMDLMSGGDALGKGFPLVYGRHFLVTLKRKSRAMIERHPGLFDAAAVERSRTLRDFDNAFTAPVHGFRDTDDYWARGSAKPHLHRIRIPALLVNARNDPFVPASSLPAAHEVGSHVQLWQPEHGGHVGFPAGDWRGHVHTLPDRVMAWIEQAL